jgi:hypothetical protein
VSSWRRQIRHHRDDTREPIVRPAYDLADAHDAHRYLSEDCSLARPSGSEHLWAGEVASVYDKVHWERRNEDRQGPAADQALAALALLAGLRDWLADVEPELIEGARLAGVTWDQLAPVLGVGDRRAAHRRAARLTGAATVRDRDRRARWARDLASGQAS